MFENGLHLPKLAKLSIPRIGNGIARPRLFKILDSWLPRAAVWITSPAGAGKTTLVASYVLERKMPCLWYQIDSDDSDPATFFYYLGIAAKQTIAPREASLPLLTPEYFLDIPGFARRYFRLLASVLLPHTMIILDNYQDLADSQLIPEILRCAIEQFPPNVQLVVISRDGIPKALDSYRADHSLEALNWDTLRLILDETRAMVRNELALDDDSIQRIHQSVGGWPAGITLLLDQFRKQGERDVFHSVSLNTIFDFFANEFFYALPESTREFLLKTSLLSDITPTIAEHLTGNKDAGQILADLQLNHFFVHQRDLQEVNYQYHALLREFLNEKVATAFSGGAYLELTRLAGRVLAEHQRQEQAISLHLQAKDWEMAIPLLLNHAPLLMAQGRSQSVSGWLSQMPGDLVDRAPWLLYWKGISHIPFNPLDAQEVLRRAYLQFDAEQDRTGKMITASAIIEITYILRQSLMTALPWLEILQRELSFNPEFPSPMIEIRVLTSLLSALTYAKPEDASLALYSQRLVDLLEKYDEDVNHKVLVQAYLIHYYAMVRGDLRSCRKIMDLTTPLLSSPDLTPLTQIIWRTLSVAFLIFSGEKVRAYESVTPSLALATDNGLQFMQSISALYIQLTRISFCDIAQYESLLNIMRALVNNGQPADEAWLYLLEASTARATRNHTDAVNYATAAWQLATEVGATLTAFEIGCFLSIAACELRQYEEALLYLQPAKAKGYANSPRITYEAQQAEAYVYLRLKDKGKCHDLLQEAFAIANRHRFFGSWLCWNQRMMSRLCAEALRAGIEPGYVRELITKRSLPSEDPTLDIWPWPVKIYTLGGFRLLIDEQPLAMNRGQQKPLLLLQAVIALGGEDVKIDRVSEILWPDTEGDAAISAFTTNLARLRKLIGEDTVHVSGGRISLDRRRCWVDAFALDYYLDNFKTINLDCDAGEFSNKIAGLYRGAFIHDESEEWAQPFRNKLRKKITRYIQRQLDIHDERSTTQLHRLLHELKDADGEILL